jgi:microcystin-dependent protein
MAYPPSIPPNNRTNGTLALNNHPSDHNVTADALTDIVNELGSSPAGTFDDVTARLAAVADALTALQEDSIGEIRAFAGAGTPPWQGTWAPCDGSEFNRFDDEALFDAIGTTWGEGNGTTTANLPDIQDGRILLAAGPNYPLGSQGGNNDAAVIEHTHSTPAHTHDAQLQHVGWSGRGGIGGGGTTIALGQQNVGGTVQWTGEGIRQSAPSGAGTTGPASGGEAAEDRNLPKYAAVSVWIKVAA